MELIPASKYREAYLSLISTQSKPFNKKNVYQPFYDSCNSPGLHSIQFKKRTFDRVEEYKKKMRVKVSSNLANYNSHVGVTSEITVPRLVTNETMKPDGSIRSYNVIPRFGNE